MTLHRWKIMMAIIGTLSVLIGALWLFAVYGTRALFPVTFIIMGQTWITMALEVKE
jgi:hypothetical protein